MANDRSIFEKEEIDIRDEQLLVKEIMNDRYNHIELVCTHLHLFFAWVRTIQLLQGSRR